MKKRLILTLAISLSIVLLGSLAFATVAPKVAPKAVIKVVPKPVVKPVAKPIAKPIVLPLVYTWATVRSKMLNANIGPNFREMTDLGSNGKPFVRLDYNYIPNYDNGNNLYSNVFNIMSLKGIVPNMDIGMGIFGNNSADPKVTANVRLALATFCEALFPKQGKVFDALTDKVTVRSAIVGKYSVDLPTVFFFGGRRIFITPHSMGYMTIDISAINDKTDIWKEVYQGLDIKQLASDKATLKKYMPELKNY